jgi:hypothetical protein
LIELDDESDDIRDVMSFSLDTVRTMQNELDTAQYINENFTTGRSRAMLQLITSFTDLRQIVVSDLQETADEEKSKQEFAQNIQQRELAVCFCSCVCSLISHQDTDSASVAGLGGRVPRRDSDSRGGACK